MGWCVVEKMLGLKRTLVNAGEEARGRKTEVLEICQSSDTAENYIQAQKIQFTTRPLASRTRYQNLKPLLIQTSPTQDQ